MKRFLLELGSSEAETERLTREERALRGRITAFQASDRLSRDDLHRLSVIARSRLTISCAVSSPPMWAKQAARTR